MFLICGTPEGEAGRQGRYWGLGIEDWMLLLGPRDTAHRALTPSLSHPMGEGAQNVQTPALSHPMGEGAGGRVRATLSSILAFHQ